MRRLMDKNMSEKKKFNTFFYRIEEINVHIDVRKPKTCDDFVVLKTSFRSRSHVTIARDAEPSLSWKVTWKLNLLPMLVVVTKIK